jgi:peptidoglycan hydrolase-like protein with peptidoglycan-binding domain
MGQLVRQQSRQSNAENYSHSNRSAQQVPKSNKTHSEEFSVNPLWRQLNHVDNACGIQRKTCPQIASQQTQSNSVAPTIENSIKHASRGERLFNSVKQSLQPVFGSKVNHVEVHGDTSARKTADALQAKAFTHQNHIFLGSGQSAQDTRLMAHETTHVMQQIAKGGQNQPGVIQRDPNDEQAPPVQLTHARFVSDRNLNRIANGQIDQLSSSQNGRNGAVSKVQSALDDMGFDLPLDRVDGRFGDETREAIHQFRARYCGDDLNFLDATALIKLDQVAPPAGQKQQHYFNYDRLFADNRLTMTVGFGFSDNNSYEVDANGKDQDTGVDTGVESTRVFREWLENQGFSLALLGLDSDQLWELTTPITFPRSDGTTETRNIRVLVTLIEPGAGAASAFRRGLASSEVTMYNGHARYGSGPDFDADSSPTENFRIGIDAAMAQAGRRTRYDEARHHGIVMDAEHDLQDMVSSGEFDPNQYRILFFQACTSMAYLDEVRSELGGTENIDVIGSRVPTYFTLKRAEINPIEVISMLSGILNGQTVEQVVDAMERNQQIFYEENGGRMPAQGVYTTSGIGDNSIVP